MSERKERDELIEMKGTEIAIHIKKRTRYIYIIFRQGYGIGVSFFPLHIQAYEERYGSSAVKENVQLTFVIGFGSAEIHNMCLCVCVYDTREWSIKKKFAIALKSNIFVSINILKSLLFHLQRMFFWSKYIFLEEKKIFFLVIFRLFSSSLFVENARFTK